jgi:hypothetical protein
MTVEYRNKQGAAVSRDRWQELYRDPAYTAPCFADRTPQGRVETCWVGVATRDHPHLFVTLAAGAAAWSLDLDAAEATHQRAVKAAGGRVEEV